MRRLSFVVLLGLFCILTTSCANTTTSNGDANTGDPFVGFFANPSSGMIELHRADIDGKYRGSLWADYGPFPIEVTRQGNTASGTVSYGGAIDSLRVESTPQGIVLTVDGTRAQAPLQRYKDMETYAKWFQAQGGYQAIAVEVTTKPSR
jgi:hypothetical protein